MGEVQEEHVNLPAFIVDNKVHSPKRESQAVDDHGPPGQPHPLRNWGSCKTKSLSPAVWCNCGCGRRACVKREWRNRSSGCGVRCRWALNHKPRIGRYKTMIPGSYQNTGYDHCKVNRSPSVVLVFVPGDIVSLLFLWCDFSGINISSRVIVIRCGCSRCGCRTFSHLYFYSYLKAILRASLNR